MILRIIDKQTKVFLRDDFDFNKDAEIGLEVEPSQGLYVPRWNGTEWVEGGVVPEPTEPEQQLSTIEEVAIALINMQAELEVATEALDILIMGGM